MRLLALLLVLLLGCTAEPAPADDDDTQAPTDDDDSASIGDDDDSAPAVDDDDSASVADDDDSAETPTPRGADLVLAAHGLAAAGQGYADLRADQDLLPAALSVSDVVEPGYWTPDLVAAAQARLLALAAPLGEDAALYLLLLGDAPMLGDDPTGLVPASHCLNLLGSCYTDNSYADLDGDGVPEVAVGRVPARTAEEATAYLGKLEQFEADGRPGLWNRRLVLFAGDSGFGAEFDAIAQGLILDTLTDVNHSFDIWGVWDNPASDWFYVPFADKVVDLFDAGAVGAFYIGHGTAAYSDGLSQDQLQAMALENRQPFAFFFACSNGSYAGDLGSLSEQVLWQAGGPIAAFAASDLTHPYANAVYPYEMQRALFDAMPPTFGDVIRLAKVASIEHQDETRDLMRALARLQDLTDEEMVLIERQSLDLYNLLGDPATPTLYPQAAVDIDSIVGSISTKSLQIGGAAPGIESGTAWVTLEVDADQHLGVLDPGATDAADINANWAIANDRVAASKEVPVLDGRFEATLAFDGELPGEAFFIKVYADDGEHDAFGHAVAP